MEKTYQGSKYFVICVLGILLRWSTSLFPYSGYGKPPMHGDYEAQRHWQEITINLPVNEWYINSTKNDLLYWGLDYPPLSSYHSYVCGVVAKWINPKYVALYESRGYESESHKLFMRYTVLIVDIFLFLPSIYFVTKMFNRKDALHTLSTLVLYPGLILIDHGHFQYNNASLGLFLLSIGCIMRNSVGVASIFFVLALNYKQMELYHALPIFFYLLGHCWRQRTYSKSIVHLINLGLIVVGSFIVCWFPFIFSLEQIKAVLIRAFPLNRGLYEDKVANFWCILSVIVKVRQIFDQAMLTKICLVVTSISSFPSCLHLLFQPTIRNLRYSLVNVSLAFFLFSYHVHEKSILLVAVPACLLVSDHPVSVTGFLITSTFSMFPLLVKDGLLIPCYALIVIFWLFSRIACEQYNYVMNYKCGILFNASIMIHCALTISSLYVTPPLRYPDLFPLLIAFYSFCQFSIAFLYFNYQQLRQDVSKKIR